MSKPKPPANDRDAVREILTAVTKNSWTVQKVQYSDGEFAEDITPESTVEAVLEEVFAVDISYVHVRRTFTDYYGWMMFVLGNDPEEVLADYTINLEPEVGPLHDKWMGLT